MDFSALFDKVVKKAQGKKKQKKKFGLTGSTTKDDAYADAQKELDKEEKANE